MITIASIDYQCPHCGEWNETDCDPSGGLDQRFVEDCAVCCYPLALHIQYDPDEEIVRVTAEEEA